MIAEAAASTPLMVLVGGVRTTEHPLARLLAKPNPEQSGGELMEAVYGALQTAGNAYVEASGDVDGDGAPDELWALRPDRVKVVPGRAGWPEAYEYAVGGQAVRIARHGDGWSPVMHLKLFHPTDDHYGFSPLEAAAFAIDVHNASGAWNKALPDVKKMPVALIAALLVQTIGGLVWAGGAAARIATLEQRVGEQRLVAERLARVEAQGEAVRATVDRIERRLEGK
jgi:HK97 family phage portal protein